MSLHETVSSYIGIKNENEFYSSHYLSSNFGGDIKELLDKWQAEENENKEKTPFSRIRAISRKWFEDLDRLSSERNTEKIADIQVSMLTEIFSILGYIISPRLHAVKDVLIPVLCTYGAKNDAPKLIILPVLNKDTQTDPLSAQISSALYKDTIFPEELKISPSENKNFSDIINDHIFSDRYPPRFIILASIGQIILIDRMKWPMNRYLRFDLNDILSRRDLNTLKAFSALLHIQSLLPDSGEPLIDSLDENSHKHAYSVSEDLKFALRESIELLGNEAASQSIDRAKAQRKGIYNRSSELSEKLTYECLRYMYRLLFLFYIEARPELGYVPMKKSETYIKGYSLESLRDLENIPLTTEESLNGTYFDQSIKMLFRLVSRGYNQDESRQKAIRGKSVFTIPRLDSGLFDPDSTELLNSVVFPNHIWQKVIRLMSLTKESRTRRGRVSYSQLGINQLGAVYEALLSYKGFFADTDLYEVKKKEEKSTELDTAYFVKEEELENYSDEEKVYTIENNHKKLKKYNKGQFIYRLAGRDRERSASYYTPEVLTKCLVKYALKELLNNKTADDILNITICEPAMGSAAFLNEAVSQLSEHYLERKQTELRERIPHDEYTQELQKIKMFFADRRVFGVDLNPVAVELAEVSLWLNAISGDDHVPWFGYQLFNGNSLIGARREVYPAHSLSGRDLWYKTAPRRLDPKNPIRKPDEVYHFLLPDENMANYTDKIAKQRYQKEFNTIKAWRNEIKKPLHPSEISHLQQLSDLVDSLWDIHTKELKKDRDKTEDKLDIYGQPPELKERTSLKTKDEIRRSGIFNEKSPNASAYRRLKLVMDYWCALWFWPIDKADMLPDRNTFWFEIGVLLRGNVIDTDIPLQRPLGYTQPPSASERTKAITDKHGQIHIEKLFEYYPRLRLVNEIAQKHKFHHWELAFADIFKYRGGFDLILGNPPWLPIKWQEGEILGDYHPLFILRKYTASELAQKREQAFSKYPNLEKEWRSELETVEATQSFLNAVQNYRELKGMKANLYKCFLPVAWRIGNESGVTGMLHPESIYDVPKGGEFRSLVYQKLRYHFQFSNELLIFAKVDHHTKFSINIYGEMKEANFHHISDLFSPMTVDLCYTHNGQGNVPGIKTDDGKWATTGHLHRILKVNAKILELFASLYDEEGTPALYARLPAIHAKELISVLHKYYNFEKKIKLFKEGFFSSSLFPETNSQKEGIIKRETKFPEDSRKVILSGPHFYTGNPTYKTPREYCKLNSDYEEIYLTEIPDHYLPRTNYSPACTEDAYQSRIPRVPWGEKKKVTEFYRICHRRMFGTSAERSLIASLIPMHYTHIHTVISSAFDNNNNMIQALSSLISLTSDYFLKSTGSSDCYGSTLMQFPFYDLDSIVVRTIVLNAVSAHYATLWRKLFTKSYQTDTWTKSSPQLNPDFYKNLTPEWQHNCALRTHYERHQALVEIDVLAAQELKLTLDELITIYRIHFPVLRQNENYTWYDQTGRIIYTCSKGLTNTGLKRREDTETGNPGWEDVKDMKSGTVEQTVIDDTLPGGPREKRIIYVAPFEKCDREEDYRIAWDEFEKRRSLNAE